MINKKTTRCYRTDKIPFFTDMVQEMLSASQKRLNSIEQSHCKSNTLHASIIHRLIKISLEQNDYLSNVVEQCKQWRNQNLTDRQSKWVDIIETKIKRLQNVNRQILFLVDHF